MRHNKKLKAVRDFMLINLGLLMMAVGIYFFKAPNGFATGGVSGLEARYIEYADDEGGMSLMMSNEFEPFITETRQFDFSTARIVRPSNRKFVSIEIESYLPSAPNDRLTVTLTLILQDGQWMLDSATY